MVFCFLPHKTQASFLTKHAEGWHWYEDRNQAQEAEEDPELGEEPSPENHPRSKQKSKQREETKEEELPWHSQQLKALQKEIQTSRDRAVMEPTYGNVKDYQRLQKAMMEHADRFSKMWLKVLYTSPELDTTLENPTAQSARHVYLDQERLILEQKVKTLSKEYGLFFFFKKGCPYCHHFAPIVKQFSERFGWKVLAISLDGGTVPEFPEATNDNGAANALGIQTVPALMAVNPKTGDVLPLSFGMTTQDQILERIKVLTQKEGP